MAYHCILFLKEECDGCGACEYAPAAFDEENPFDIEYDDIYDEV